MTYVLFHLQQHSHETLTLILVAGGVSSAIVVAFALYLHSLSSASVITNALRLRSAALRQN